MYPTLTERSLHAVSGTITTDVVRDSHAKTGAFADCKNRKITTAPPHPDQRSITISCHTLSYRIPPFESLESILIGVLSAAGGEGPERRQSIRETWAQNHAVLFLVAGPWEDIEEEYKTYHDLVWINEEEVYNGEKSVLTYKTMAFVQIAHNLSTSNGFNIKYIFKTDDDSYVQIPLLYEVLLERDHEEYNYWGWCQDEEIKPVRDGGFKWSISYETYPESTFPRYCQGAGFALSWKFIDCAAGSKNHISRIRFMPFEDVAMGLLAFRCGMSPTMAGDKRLLHMYRTDRAEEVYRVNHGQDKIDKSMFPVPDMTGRILQHRIDGPWDMREHYLSIHDPDYAKKTKINWSKYKRHDD